MAKGFILGQDPNLSDVENKIQQVDSKFSNYLPLSGGIMKGNIKLTNEPIDKNDVINVDYLNNQLDKINPSWIKIRDVKISKSLTSNEETPIVYSYDYNMDEDIFIKIYGTINASVQSGRTGTAGFYVKNKTYNRAFYDLFYYNFNSSGQQTSVSEKYYFNKNFFIIKNGVTLIDTNSTGINVDSIILTKNNINTSNIVTSSQISPYCSLTVDLTFSSYKRKNDLSLIPS